MLINPNLTVVQRTINLARLRSILERVRPFLPERRPVIRLCAIATNGSNADLARFRRDINQARTVWGACGILFEEGSFTPINMGGEFPNWRDVNTAPPELLAQRGGCGAREVRVYYVQSIGGSRTQGRSAFMGGEPGYVGLSADAHINLFPHELGHLFLGGNQEHRDGSSPADRVNVMRSNVGTIEGLPQVDSNQCARARTTALGGRFGSGSGEGDTGPATQLALMGGLRDPNPVVRATCLQALAMIGSPVAQASIRDQVLVEPDPSVRALAYGLALGMRL